MIVSSFIIFMAVAFWLVTIFGKKTSGEGEVMDVQRSEEGDQKSSHRQLIAICLWVIGFLLLILLFGFLYLKCEGKEGWAVSICMSAGVWACFYFLFIWLLQTSFPEGWIMAWLSGA
jgi:Trk-type K+ transport system membrane component